MFLSFGCSWFTYCESSPLLIQPPLTLKGSFSKKVDHPFKDLREWHPGHRDLGMRSRSPYHWLLKWLSCVAPLQLKSRNFCAVTQEARKIHQKNMSGSWVLTKDLGSSQSPLNIWARAVEIGRSSLKGGHTNLNTWEIVQKFQQKIVAKNRISAQQKYKERCQSPKNSLR